MIPTKRHAQHAVLRSPSVKSPTSFTHPVAPATAPCTIHPPNANKQILTSVTPNMSIVPRKYHIFISPSLRRVFLDGREDMSPRIINNLNTEIAALNERVMLLERDKVLLTDRCDRTRRKLASVSADEQAARADALKDKESLDRLRAEHDALKFRARIQLCLLDGSALLLIFFILASTMVYLLPECWGCIEAYVWPGVIMILPTPPVTVVPVPNQGVLPNGQVHSNGRVSEARQIR